MAKKVLYLGNSKWCWTENCSQHAKVIADKAAYVQAKETGDEGQILKASSRLISTPEGLHTYRYLKTQELRNELGRQPVLGLDLDNTTGDFTVGLREYEATKLKLPKDEWLSHFPDPDEYSMWMGENAWYPSQENFLERLRTAENEGIYLRLPVYPEASNTLHDLKAYGFRLKAITARSEIFNVDTRAWITEGKIPTKTILNPGNDKHKIKNVDVYMDDSPHVINTLLENDKNVIAMKQSYNGSNIPEHDNVRHVDQWGDGVVEAVFDLVDKNRKNNK